MFSSKKTPFTILFVCSGNLYRSRLAQAYLRSQKLSNIIVSSCGTKATSQHKGPLAWYTLRLLYRHHLLPFMSPSWIQATKPQFKNVNLAIFMGKNNFEFCQKWLSPSTDYEIWSLPDFDDRDLNGKPIDTKREIKSILVSEKVFSLITKKVDKLMVTYKLDNRKS